MCLEREAGQACNRHFVVVVGAELPAAGPLSTFAPCLPTHPHTHTHSQYVSEVVGALCEAPIKLKDVPAALAVASALHQRYAEFNKELVGALAKLSVAAGGWRAGGR